MTALPTLARLTAVFAAALVTAATARAADVPPLPPLPEPLPSLLGTSGAPQSEAPQSSPAGTVSSSQTARVAVATQLQLLVAAEINVVRRSYGRSRLSVSAQLTRAGEAHARQLALAGYFSHAWSDGTPFGGWIKRFYPVGRSRLWRTGENLEWSTQELSARDAVELWLGSPEHRRILLDPRWRQVGLGAVRAEGAGGVYGGQSVLILAAEFGLRR